MKKTTAIVMLLVSSILTSFAQTRADRIFNISDKYIYNTDTVHLQNNNKVIIEMADVTDYVMLKNLDSVVRLLQQDIEFYKDSFKELDNVRIDYALEKDSDNTKLRFRKYQPAGDIYVKRGGQFARMKLEQDTIRIVLKKPLLEHNSHMSFYDFPVQITLLLNNYAADLSTVLNDRILNQAIDTIATASLPKVYDPNISQHRTTVDYWPYLPKKKLVRNTIDDGEERHAVIGRK